MVDELPVDRVDLSVRAMLDAESLTDYMLHADFPESSGVLVASEATPRTDSASTEHPVILYSCGAPYQTDGNQRAWIWRYSLTLNVIGPDAGSVFRVAARLNRCIALWPYRDPTPYGKVAALPSNPGFQRLTPGVVQTSKMTKRYVSEKVVQAYDPETPSLARSL